VVTIEWIPAASLPKAEQAADRWRRWARDAAVARAAAALRELGLDEVLTDRDLQAVANHATDAALAMPAQQHDLFGTQGRLVARLWWAQDQLRWELERLRSDQAITHLDNGERSLP
jgi:hypothetical protein